MHVCHRARVCPWQESCVVVGTYNGCWVPNCCYNNKNRDPPLNLRDCLHHSLANTHLATFASWHDYEEEEMPTEDLMSVQKESTMPDGLGG